jgi:hypothetical protein
MKWASEISMLSGSILLNFWTSGPIFVNYLASESHHSRHFQTHSVVRSGRSTAARMRIHVVRYVSGRVQTFPAQPTF